jgi:hypothetical protein
MRIAALVMTCCGLLLALGCGGSPAGLPHVQGRVFYHGKPLTGGTVVFTPDPERGGSGPMAWGTIEADGRYRLSTDGRNGASLGWHRITIAGDKADTLPASYRDPELSEQRFEVRADRANLCDLHLE